MPVSQSISVNITTTTIYTGILVKSGGQVSLPIPFTSNNMKINSWSYATGGSPTVIYQLDSQGTPLTTSTPGATSSNPNTGANALTATLTLPNIVHGTAAVVVQSTVTVDLSIVSGQTSGTFTPTQSVVEQNPPSSFTPSFQANGPNLSLGSAAVPGCVNYPSSNRSTASAGTPTRTSSPKREIVVSVPVTVTPSQSTPKYYLQVNFTVALNFTS